MARKARVRSDFQHIIVRGIGKQVLFEGALDYRYYLRLLERFSGETEVEILAYCLMENHVHLLVYDVSGNAPVFMKKMGISYASYYNRKYERVGHLFQDRYKSEPVYEEANLLTVYRYILQNPVKAGIAGADEYPWSSYRDYFQKGGLTDPELFRKLVGDRGNFTEFMSSVVEPGCMEYEPEKHDDSWAQRVICETLGVSSGTALQSMDRVSRDLALVQLKRKGISVRQLERLTGITRGVIQKAGR